MNTTTQCPQCNTRFKITQEQLNAHQGVVRCGRCHAVFNAAHNLHDDQPSPQLSLPIELEEIWQTPAGAEAALATSTHENLDFSNIALPREERRDNIESAAPDTLSQSIIFADVLDAAHPEPAKKAPRKPWAIGCLLLFIVLLAQAAYFFRVELAANLPGLKPLLISYCELLHCTVPLPQKTDLMSIESSDLEADPTQTNVIFLNAILRNRAPYAQAYPNLELALTDTQDKVLARRTFRPAEYLKPGEDEKQGLAANREFSLKLKLDTTDLKASGYRLFLLHPQ